MSEEQTADLGTEIEGLEKIATDKDAIIAELQARIAEQEAQLEAGKAAALYAQAEAQNVRRRAEKEVADAKAYATMDFARDLMVVADNLGRALESMPDPTTEQASYAGPLIQGIQMIQREMDSVLARHNISKIVALGQPLDPTRHQAVVEEASSDAAPGTVIREFSPGYMLRDRLLRPAMVVVAKAAE